MIKTEKIFIVPTSSAEHIGRNLELKQGIEVLFTAKNGEGKRIFPDGEIYVRIPMASELKNGSRVIVLHSGAPDPNGGLMELESVLQILNDAKVPSIELFFTYFPYGRQDAAFKNGETNAAENLVKKLTKYYGVGKIYAIDAHFSNKEWVKKYPIINISAFDLLDKAALKDFPDFVSLVPDIGAQRRTGLNGTTKKRKDSYTTEIRGNGSFEVWNIMISGRVVAVFDDIIATGGTLENFYDTCVKFGAKDAIVMITHGVLPSGIKRIKGKYSRLYLTNTICRSESNVDITDIVFETIKGDSSPCFFRKPIDPLHNNFSVFSFFGIIQ